MLAPDALILNGRIATMDAARSECEALAVLGGRIVARGSTAAMRALAGPATRIIDLEGRRAIPGIVDSHAHPDAEQVLRVGHEAHEAVHGRRLRIRT